MEAKPSFTNYLLVLGAKLGSGTFGVVHQAQYGDLPCAAKAFFVSQSELDRKTIDKEIVVLQRLRFRHVIQFYRTHEQNDRIYILMELAEKGSLTQAINKGLLACDDWVTKRRLAHEIAQGLAYIHQEGVLHRDLKSANILLTKHMEVKLADFGLAQIRSMASIASSVRGHTSKGAAGTLRWLAPELLYADKPRYSTKSDVYALGVVMWEMAADCTRPFKDQHDDEVIALGVKNGRREELPDDTPTDYRRWVERCWAKDPLNRPNAGNVILVHNESTEDSTDTDGSFFDLGSSETGSAHVPDAHNRDGGGFEQDAMFEQHDDYAGRLPQTDDDVVTYFCKAAKAEKTDAQLFLGWIYGHGRGVAKSEQDSFWWYRKAASGGNVVAQFSGTVVNQGDRSNQSLGMAVKWFTRAAELGDASAQGSLGWMCDQGRGVDQSDVEAVKWYAKAAEQGNTNAQYNLGLMYAHGRGVDQSDVEAVKWFTNAAEQGNANAQNNLGLMYAQGQGVDQSDVEAVKWFTKAAMHGHANAQFSLGFMYEHGRGVDQRDVDAVKWYAEAAEQGNIDAQHNLGLMYAQGQGVDKSDVEAVKWFTKAATHGHANAQLSLGFMYKHGRGVDQRDVDAVKWYSKAAEQGDANAQYNLGVMYEKGRGVDQSDVEAVKWFTKAAEQGYASAQYGLAVMYEEGRGFDQSDVEA
ncbi:copper transport protein ctr1, partial [Actinomortierella ambigua]